MQNSNIEADIILHKAIVKSLDNSYPDVSAVAIIGSRIAAIGSEDDIAFFQGTRTLLIDCRGAVVVPGFHDAHCHPVGFAESLLNVNVNADHVHSIDDIVAAVRLAGSSAVPGKWLRAGRYNEYYLKEKRHPTRWDLDKAATLHPVKLSHRSGHAHVLNSLGLAIAGITIETPDPPGGMIDRDSETGEPNGIVYNMGSYLANIIPPVSEEDLDRGIKLANDELLMRGITSIQDSSERNDIIRWQMFRRWKRLGILKPRVTMMLGSKAFQDREKDALTPQAGDDQLRLGAVKIVLGETSGGLYPSLNDLKTQVLAIHREGFQAALHAFEPSEIDAAGQSIEYAILTFPRSDHRHRIEHCSVCTGAMAKRLASLGIIVVTQPPFIYHSGDRYLDTVPENELSHLYPLARLLNSGMLVAASSDCPVVPPDVLIGIYGAVSRMTKSDRPFMLEQRVTALDALRMYTTNAAFASFSEESIGMITPGKYADLVVLSADPTAVDINVVPDIQVEMTLINGEIVWEKPGFRR